MCVGVLKGEYLKLIINRKRTYKADYKFKRNSNASQNSVTKITKAVANTKASI